MSELSSNTHLSASTDMSVCTVPEENADRSALLSIRDLLKTMHVSPAWSLHSSLPSWYSYWQLSRACTWSLRFKIKHRRYSQAIRKQIDSPHLSSLLTSCYKINREDNLALVRKPIQCGKSRLSAYSGTGLGTMTCQVAMIYPIECGTDYGKADLWFWTGASRIRLMPACRIVVSPSKVA